MFFDLIFKNTTDIIMNKINLLFSLPLIFFCKGAETIFWYDKEQWTIQQSVTWLSKKFNVFVCLFWFHVPFFTHMETPLILAKAANFDLYSALMTIEQWRFFSVPHLLWHGISVCLCHLQGPVTLTPIAERLAVELSLPAFTI